MRWKQNANRVPIVTLKNNSELYTNRTEANTQKASNLAGLDREMSRAHGVSLRVTPESSSNYLDGY
jgi:hypothetical protein